MTLFLTQLKGKKGVEINRIDKIMRNAVDSNEMVFENFEVFENEIVGEEGKGFRCLLDGLNPERIAVAYTAIGLGRGALNLAVQYAKDRIVFDRPIGKNQAVAHPLADSWIRLEAAELMAQKAAQAVRRGQALRTGGQRCEVPRDRGRLRGSGPGDAVPRRLQHVDRVPRLAILDGSAASEDRADQPGDGAELHLGQGPRPAQVLLIGDHP